MKLLSVEDAKTLAECYKLGCLIEGKQVNNNDMCDLIRMAEATRNLNVLIGLIIEGNLPTYFKDGTITLVCDKADSLNINKNEVKK
jgi:hypothetical protein